MCAECGGGFTLGRRAQREHERRGQPHVCHDCRHPGSGPTPEQIEAAQRRWLERYSRQELQSWPPLP